MRTKIAIDDEITQFAVDYLLNRGSSVHEINKMATDGTLVKEAVSNFTSDRKYLGEQGFSNDEIRKLGSDLGAIAKVYSSEMDKGEFLDQFSKQKSLDYSIADDYEKLEERIEGINWERVRDVASRAAMIALYAGGAVLGGAILSGETASAETQFENEAVWYHWSPADLNYDWKIDNADLEILMSYWLSNDVNDPNFYSTEAKPGVNMYIDDANDLSNPNNFVDMRDFAVFASEYGRVAAEEFGVDHGKIKVSVKKGYGIDDEISGNPEIGTEITVKNASNYPDPGQYHIDNVISNVGTAQGITGVDEIGGGTIESWSFDPHSNPNQIKQWTVLYPIFPENNGGPKEKTFTLYVNDSDPNNLVFKNKDVEASSEFHNCNTVNVPMPHNKLMAD